MSDPEDDRRDDDRLEPVRDGGRREAAHYIMSEIGQLAALARRHEHTVLGYLLDMALLEARAAAGRPDEQG